MRKVIITGPTGAIGHALIDKCLDEGCEVFAICRPNSARIKSLPKNAGLHVLEYDLSELEKAKEALWIIWRFSTANPLTRYHKSERPVPSFQ